MMGRTHALSGVSSLWLLALLPVSLVNANWGVLAVCAALGALLPDLDATESLIKHVTVAGIKPFVLPSIIANKHLGHRGLLHSLLGWGLCALFTLPVIFWLNWQYWLVLLLGYGSHLLGDLCTVTGIPLLYPRPKRYSPLPKSWRLTTGSVAEEIVFVLCAIAVLPLLLWQVRFLIGAP